MPPGSFISEVVIRFVLVDRTAESQASLYAGVCRIGRCAKGVDGLEIAIAEVSVDVAVEVVRSGAGDDVDHAARGASVFGGITVGDDLEFLHRFLGDGGADSVDSIVGGVGAIDVDQVGTAPLAADVEAGSGRGSGVGRVIAEDLRIGQREIDVVAAVNRQIVDAALADGVSGGTARGFNQFGLGADFDDFFAARDGDGDR